MAEALALVVLPAELTPAFCAEMTAALDAATRVGPEALKTALPAETCVVLLDRCQRLIQTEPTMREVGWGRPHPAPQHWNLKGAAAAPACRRLLWRRQPRPPPGRL